MFHFILVATLLAANEPTPTTPPPPVQHNDPICYDYYLKMRDLEFGSLEYVTQRNKRLELKCGAFHKADPATDTEK